MRRAGREGRFDDVVGRGFQLIVAGGDPLAAAVAASSARCSTRLDVDRRLADPAVPEASATSTVASPPGWPSTASHAVLVRPDFYVFGSVARSDDAAGAARRPSIPASAHIHTRHRRSAAHDRLHLVIHPKFHHVNLKTTRLQEMIDFYADARRRRGDLPVRRSAPGCRNDAANHRIALLAFPNFVDDPEKDTPHRACITPRSSTRASRS